MRSVDTRLVFRATPNCPCCAPTNEGADATGEWGLSRALAEDDEDVAELGDDASRHARQASV